MQAQQISKVVTRLCSKSLSGSTCSPRVLFYAVPPIHLLPRPFPFLFPPVLIYLSSFLCFLLFNLDFYWKSNWEGFPPLSSKNKKYIQINYFKFIIQDHSFIMLREIKEDVVHKPKGGGVLCIYATIKYS